MELWSRGHVLGFGAGPLVHRTDSLARRTLAREGGTTRRREVSRWNLITIPQERSDRTILTHRLTDSPTH